MKLLMLIFLSRLMFLIKIRSLLLNQHLYRYIHILFDVMRNKNSRSQTLFDVLFQLRMINRRCFFAPTKATLEIR
jgi:hypothetical protein